MDENAIFSPGYPVELLSRQPFEPDPEVLRTALSRRLGHVDLLGGGGTQSALPFVLRDYPVELNDATVPAQIAFVMTDKAIDPSSCQQALAQSWDIDDPEVKLSQCRHSMAMINLMSSPLPQKMRRDIIAGGLLALLEIVDADLIHWTPAEQFIDPQSWVRRMSDADQKANPAYGFVNVRFYNIEDSDDEKVMDTLGLGALGLTDLQMHYRDLEPGHVAGLLYDIAAYLLENGDMIDNGHTVQGLQPEDHWLCMHEMSLLAPERLVLDIDPGPPFAAGGRG